MNKGRRVNWARRAERDVRAVMALCQVSLRRGVVPLVIGGRVRGGGREGVVWRGMARGRGVL